MKSEECIALDVDGAIADTCQESYLLVERSWPSMYRTKYPLSPEEFRELIRPYITSVEDFYTFSLALRDGMKIPGESLENLATVRSIYKEQGKNGKKWYRIVREQLQKNPEEWLKAVPVFNGVPEMFTELGGLPVEICVVSSKDRDSISLILEGNATKNGRSLYSFVRSIITDSHGGREQQFRLLGRTYTLSDSVAYDDSAENLTIAERMGIHTVAAPQGYDVPERIERFRKAYPQELPGVVRDILNI